MLAGNVRGPLRESLARAFSHSAMKQTAVAFTRRPIHPRLAFGLDRQKVQQPLIDVATAFVQLQEARHDADYNRAKMPKSWLERPDCRLKLHFLPPCRPPPEPDRAAMGRRAPPRGL